MPSSTAIALREPGKGGEGGVLATCYARYELQENYKGGAWWQKR